MFGRRSLSARAALCALALAAAALPLASGAAASANGASRAPLVSATLTQCVTSVTQAERSATYSGEMSLVPGATKMAMRIDVEERLPHEALYHTVVAPGASSWRSSEPKVKVFKYLKQVTDLSAPARYRASVHFRWFNSHGATIRRAARLTRACNEPASPPPASATS